LELGEVKQGGGGLSRGKFWGDAREETRDARRERREEKRREVISDQSGGVGERRLGMRNGPQMGVDDKTLIQKFVLMCG
jgi:hypothetical protein